MTPYWNRPFTAADKHSDSDFDGYPTTKRFHRTLGDAFGGPEYGAAVERPARRAGLRFLDAICWVLSIVMIAGLINAWFVWDNYESHGKPDGRTAVVMSKDIRR